VKTVMRTSPRKKLSVNANPKHLKKNYSIAEVATMMTTIMVSEAQSNVGVRSQWLY